MILLALALLGAGPPVRLARVDRLLAELPAGTDTLRVIATIVSEEHGGWPDSSVEMVRFVDRRGRVQFTDSMPPSLGPAGELGEESLVQARAITFEGGVGVRLDRSTDPSPPSYRGDCRWFALRNGKPVPVTPWCIACSDLLPGNRAMASDWTGWFRAVWPEKIHFERPQGGLELVPPRDKASGLAILEIKEVEQVEPDPSSSFRIRLYRRPIGVDGDFVGVKPTSRVKIGRVFGTIVTVGLPGDEELHYFKFSRLEVTVDGRKGFIEESDFPAVRLQQAG